MEEGVMTGLVGGRGQEETGNWEGRQLDMLLCVMKVNVITQTHMHSPFISR